MFGWGLELAFSYCLRWLLQFESLGRAGCRSFFHCRWHRDNFSKFTRELCNFISRRWQCRELVKAVSWKWQRQDMKALGQSPWASSSGSAHSLQKEMKMFTLSGICLKGLRTNSEARQQPYEIHTLKRQRESKLPRQTLVPAAYRVGRITKLKISTHSYIACLLYI